MGLDRKPPWWRGPGLLVALEGWQMILDGWQMILDALQITLDALQFPLDGLQISESILEARLHLVRACGFVLRTVRDDGASGELAALIGVPY